MGPSSGSQAMAAAQVMASDGQGGAVAIVSSAAGLISLPGGREFSLFSIGSEIEMTKPQG